MKINHGWVYREPASGATPPRIRVKFKQDLHGVPDKIFDDNSQGATEAAEWISHNIGDSWKLEDLEFLGYRIVTVS